MIDLRDKTIEELKKENEELKLRSGILENGHNELKNIFSNLQNEHNELKNKFSCFEAISKLHDCDTLVNNTFKKEYHKWYKLKKHDYVPNLGEFVKNHPDKDDDFNFLKDFCNKYPNSDTFPKQDFVFLLFYHMNDQYKNYF